jgi:hypothetical protein
MGIRKRHLLHYNDASGNQQVTERKEHNVNIPAPATQPTGIERQRAIGSVAGVKEIASLSSPPETKTMQEKLNEPRAQLAAPRFPAPEQHQQAQQKVANALHQSNANLSALWEYSVGTEGATRENALVAAQRYMQTFQYAGNLLQTLPPGNQMMLVQSYKRAQELMAEFDQIQPPVQREQYEQLESVMSELNDVTRTACDALDGPQVGTAEEEEELVRRRRRRSGSAGRGGMGFGGGRRKQQVDPNGGLVGAAWDTIAKIFTGQGGGAAR